MSGTTPIAPDLFTPASDFGRKVTEGTWSEQQARENIGLLLFFARNFFLQFFAEIVKSPIKDFGPKGRKAAVRAKLRLERDGAAPEVLAVVGQFEDLCNLYEDLGGLYGDDEDDDERAAVRYTARLLRRIVRWAQGAELPAVAAAATEAADAIDAAEDLIT